MNLNVVVLAAGKGTRMYSSVPKVLHPLAGQSMVRHVIQTASALQPEQICVVYGHGGESVPQALADCDAQFVLQQPQQGTGHAVMQAMPLLPDGVDGAPARTLVLYGDVPLIGEQTLRRLLDAGDGLVLLTETRDDPTGYGRIVRDDKGHVQAIVEQKDATVQQQEIKEVNTGILLAPTAELRVWLQGLSNDNAQGEYYLTDIVSIAVQQGVRVDTAQPEYGWESSGVNNKTQLAELERIYQQQIARQLLQQGVTLADPARLDVRGQLDCGQDVFIDVGCVFEGEVTLGDGVHIGPNCVIRDSHIQAGTQVEAFSHLQQCQVGDNSRIGPYARLRPGAQLQSEVHIGNFVEVKNTEIAQGSKANHLSYLGDTTVGRGVNIGAGTITCNYDGANKHRTVIGDHAFIGSDTQLVAPVTVGTGATIGAGSTITKDTPDHELTLSRSKQQSIKNWQRPVKK